MIRALPLLLLLGGCATPMTDKPKTVGGSDAACKADGLDDLVGKTGSSALAAEALKRSGARVMRWIQPEMIVTADLRRDRLEIDLNTHNA